MSLDDLIDQLIVEKSAVAAAATVKTAVTAGAPSSSNEIKQSFDELIKTATNQTDGAQAGVPAPANPGKVEVSPEVQADLSRLRQEVLALRNKVEVLKAENEALKSQPQVAAAAGTAPAAAVQAAQATGAAPAASASAFPWKRHVATVEDALRKKDVPIADCVLKVLADVREIIPAEPQVAARLLTQLATIRIEQNKLDEAQESLQKGLKLLEEAQQDKTLAAAFCYDAIAQCHQLREDYEQAEKFRRHGLVIAEASLGAEHPDSAFFRERLEELRRERSIAQIGADDQSKTVLDKLTAEYNAAVAETGQPPVTTETAPSDNYSGLMFDKYVQNGKNAITQKNYREAESFLKSAMEKADALPNADPRKCDGIKLLADCLLMNNKDQEAKETYEKCLTIAFKFIGWNDPHVAECLGALAVVTSKMNDLGTSKNYYKQAVAAYIVLHGKESEQTVKLEAEYAEFIEKVKQENKWKGWSQ